MARSPQKAHDPLGFRVFEVLRAAVRGAVEAWEFDVVHGDPRIRNDTCLALSPARRTAGRRTADAVPREKLPPLVTRWVDELLADLVLATGAARRQVEGRLRLHLFDLEAEGVEVFRFKDLVDSLKDGLSKTSAADARSVRGRCLAGLGRRDEAGPLLREGYETLRQELGEDARQTRQAAARLAAFR